MSTPNTNEGAISVAAHSPGAVLRSSERETAKLSNYGVARSGKPQNQRLRPEVQHAMQALREMPPFAREREIETGRYSHFSPEERTILRTVE